MAGETRNERGTDVSSMSNASEVSALSGLGDVQDAGEDGDRGEGREYRIDELARLAATTVRNVRAYQDRGLLPSARRQGRVAFYSDAHLARLKVIIQLLERGYTLASIRELIDAWQSGQNVGDLLGLETALAAPWKEEEPTVVTADELAGLFGDTVADPRLLGLALELGVVEQNDDAGDSSDDTFLVRKPRLLYVGAQLVSAGIPLDAVLSLGLRLREQIDEIATEFVQLAVEHVFDPLGEPIPAAEVPRLAEVVRRLRPLAKDAVESELADAMERHVHEHLRLRLDRMLEGMKLSSTEAS